MLRRSSLGRFRRIATRSPRSAIDSQTTRDPQHKRSISGTQLGQLSRRLAIEAELKRSGHSSDIPHPTVYTLQVAPRSDRAWIVARELVQELGLDSAIHKRETIASGLDVQQRALTTESRSKRR
jgi:hypothetical protein